MFVQACFMAALASLALSDPCPPGSFSDFFSQKCFHVVSLNTTFQKAQSVCANFGANLASIHNKYDNAFVEENVSGDFWLGASDKNDNDVWRWADGSKLDYSNWAASQPSHNAEDDCLLVDKMSGLWTAKPCSRMAFFVCETAANNITPCPSPKPIKCLST
ncbi:hypothetical protein L596_016914 [Steinernema carpocapsae]|uniref:C-type lectin domain-containing protein n=1 Tax=Steinernema carpocapsae TaxID=34508 RepID=A0A4U5NKK1_STECR|nr:hypothetical protein L596_016914 [Steinernema carpocapsae]